MHTHLTYLKQKTIFQLYSIKDRHLAEFKHNAFPAIIDPDQPPDPYDLIWLYCLPITVNIINTLVERMIVH